VAELHADRNPGFGGMHPEPIGKYMPEAMAKMAAGGFDLCIANDGDSDRVGIIDETGRFVTQLEVMALLAMYCSRSGIARASDPVAHQRGDAGSARRAFQRPGHRDPSRLQVHRSKMIETDALLAGEESGGFAFRGHIPERDGIVAGLTIAEMVVAYGMPLSRVLQHLFDLVGPHSYARHDIRFERADYDERKHQVEERMRGQQPKEIAGVAVVGTRSDDGFKFLLADTSWVLVRMSGTEPQMRVYAEAASPERVEELLAAMGQMVGIGAPQPGAGAR